MRIAVRDDDAALLALVHDKTGLGTLTRKPARGSSRPQIAWQVSSKADCLRLRSLLVRYPLRGRKGGNFALWSDAVSWWVGSDATRRIVNRDWAPLVYIKDRLSEKTAYSSTPPPPRDPAIGMSPDWVSYMSGLFTADGSFGVHVNGSSLVPVARIALRSDDAPLLSELWLRTDVGRLLVGDTPPAGKVSPEASWTVRRATDAEHLADLLDRSPPRGRKREQFRLWRDAVGIYANSGGGRGGRARLERVRAELAVLQTYVANHEASS
jgi:hypothetical protein